MKQLIIFIYLLAIFGCVFSSCSKEQCSGVYCFNNGVCSNGKCNCPPGYSGGNCGNLDTTEIDYYNNTFTPITIVINYVNRTIPVDSYFAIRWTYGSVMTATASTSSATLSGAQVGLKLYWTLSDSFGLSKKTVYINVSPEYFFLKIANTSSNNINYVYVNYGLSAQSVDYITIPNTGNTYDIGYYRALANSNLYLTSATNSWNYTFNLPFTLNQSYTYVAAN